MGRPKYSFPIIEGAQLLAELRVFLKHQFNDEDVLAPHMESILPIYEELVAIALGQRKESFCAPELEAFDGAEQPDLLIDFSSNGLFFGTARYLMNLAGVKDFKMKDFIKPEPQRTARNISALVNFSKFRLNNDWFTVEDEKKKLLMERTAELEDGLLRLQTVKAELLEQRKADEPEVDVIEKEIHQMEEAGMRKNAEHSRLLQEMNQAKAAVEGLKNKLGVVTFKLTALKDTQRELKASILESPDQYEAEYESLAKKLEDERADARKADQKDWDLSKILNYLMEAREDFQKVLVMVKELEAEKAGCKEESRLVKEATEQVAARMRERDDLVREEASLRAKLEALPQGSECVNRQMEEEREKAVAARNQIRNQWRIMRDKVAKDCEQAKKLADETEAMKEKRDKTRALSIKEEERCKSLEMALELACWQYCEQLQALEVEIMSRLRLPSQGMKPKDCYLIPSLTNG